MTARAAAIVSVAVLAALTLLWLRVMPQNASPAQAVTTTVNVGDNWFSNSTSNDCGNPCVTNVGVGDTVHWVWIGANDHSSSSDIGSAQAWDSGIHANGFTFDVTFPNAGSFSYHCNVHASMHGTIVVGGGSPTPTSTPAPTTPAPTNTPAPTTPTATSPGPTATRTPSGLVGDANKDGHVNAIDAALVLQYSAGLLSTINLNADANHNGQINAIDATLILQFDAGLLSHLPP